VSGVKVFSKSVNALSLSACTLWGTSDAESGLHVRIKGRAYTAHGPDLGAAELSRKAENDAASDAGLFDLM
jgi:hypothetical protein